MFLQELLDNTNKEHRKELSELKFLELLREKARNSHIVVKRTPIFREDKGSDYMLVTPGEKENKSAFWIDKIVKNLQSWTRYPSRTKFIKGFTTIDRIGGIEDDQYVVIPLDGSRIGICPDSSFYRSFHLTKSMGFDRIDNDNLAKWIYEVFMGISELYPDINIEARIPESYSEFKKMVSELDSAVKHNLQKLKTSLKTADLSDQHQIILKDLLNRYVSSIDSYLNEKFDPEDNNFSASKIESFNMQADDKEIWISDPCLLIKRSKYVELHKNGSIK